MLRVFGKGSDFVEIDGDKCPTHQKFKQHKTTGIVLGFSDGTLLHVRRTNINIWEIEIIKHGLALLEHRENLLRDDGTVTDEIILRSYDIDWVVCGDEFKVRKSVKGCSRRCQNKIAT